MKKIFFIFIYLVLLIISFGCRDVREPQSLEIVTSILYDCNEYGQIISAKEVMNPAANTALDSSNIDSEHHIITIAKGETLPDAVSNFSSVIEKVNFGGNNKVRFFTERLVKSDKMATIFDFLTRAQLTDETPLLVVVKGDKPYDVFNSEMGLSKLVGTYIDDLSKFQHQQTSRSVFTTALDFIKDHYNPGKQPVLGMVELVETELDPYNLFSGDEEIKTQMSQQSGKAIKYEGLAAFKDDVMVGYLNGVDTRNYNIITNKMGVDFISIPNGSDFTVLVISKSKTKIDTAVLDDEVMVKLDINLIAGFIQISGDIDVTKGTELKKIEKSCNKQVKNEIDEVIKKVQNNFQSDIFGFGSYVHMQHPKEWDKLKDNWDDKFSNAKIEIKVNTSITKSGEIKKPFGMEEIPLE